MNKPIGQVAYEAYYEDLVGKSPQIPPWDKAPIKIQQAWEAAAQAVVIATKNYA